MPAVASGARVASDHLENFFQVDEKVYRSAQPSRNAFRELDCLGIRNVLDLRELNLDAFRSRGTCVTVRHLPLDPSCVTEGEVVSALRIIREARGPILVHCKFGSDRTGVVVAFYRIVFQGWTKEAAIEEMTQGGYGFHPQYAQLIRLIRSADVDRLAARVMSGA
jgi:protein tyrosine phosphatase (PTP) superfamily phosphohydrolase (DUF442 family)